MVWTRVRVDEGGLRARLSNLLLSDVERIKMLDQVGEASVREVKQHFINQKSPEGVPWKPSKRALADPSRPTLLHTLKLLNSITYVNFGGQVEIGTPDIRAGTLNFGARRGQYGAMRNGTPIPFGNIPARKFIGVSPKNVAQVRDIVNGFLRSRLR